MLNKKIGYIVTFTALILILTLVLVKTNLDEKAASTCELIDENPNVTMEECPYHQSNTVSWLIFISFGIVIFIFGSGLYLIFKSENGKREEGKNFKEVDISKLGDDEEEVYTLLKNNDGSMYQSDLVKETDFSKVKVTRLLDKLETKNIAERKRRGMTNLVVLK